MACDLYHLLNSLAFTFQSFQMCVCVLTEFGIAPEVLGGKFGRVRRETLLEKVGDQVRHDD